MAASISKSWIEYLKSGRIASMKSDPSTGRLVYLRQVFSDDLIRFLELRCDLDPGVPEQLVNEIVSSHPQADVPAQSAGGFIDDKGVPLTEEDVLNVFAKVDELVRQSAEDERAAEQGAKQAYAIERIKAMICSDLDWSSRGIFASVLKANMAGQAVLDPAKAYSAFQALVPEPKPTGLLASFFRKSQGPTPEQLEDEWGEAGFPLGEDSFFKFLASKGFGRDQIQQALQTPDIESTSDAPQFTALLNFVAYVSSNIDKEGQDDVLRYIESLPDIDDDDGSN